MCSFVSQSVRFPLDSYWQQYLTLFECMSSLRLVQKSHQSRPPFFVKIPLLQFGACIWVSCYLPHFSASRPIFFSGLSYLSVPLSSRKYNFHARSPFHLVLHSATSLCAHLPWLLRSSSSLVNKTYCWSIKRVLSFV